MAGLCYLAGSRLLYRNSFSTHFFFYILHLNPLSYGF